MGGDSVKEMNNRRKKEGGKEGKKVNIRRKVSCPHYVRLCIRSVGGDCLENDDEQLREGRRVRRKREEY